MTGVESQINNVVAAISEGLLSQALAAKLRELEDAKEALESELRRENLIQQTSLTFGDVTAYLQQFANGDKMTPCTEKN